MPEPIPLPAALPDVPPSSAREALERCAVLQQRLESELYDVRDQLLAELGQVRQGQRTAIGYAPPRPTGRRIATTA